MNRFAFKKQIKSIIHASNGLVFAFKNEPKTYIHLLVQISTIFLGFLYQITIIEWLFLISILGIMFAFELANTAIEELCNHITPENHINIKNIKDLASAMVFFTAIIGAIIGILIFYPKIF